MMPKDKHTTLSGFLTAALDMEDQMSRGVYREYLNRETWPDELSATDYNKITKCLNVLIKDTVKHRNTILEMINKYGKNIKTR